MESTNGLLQVKPAFCELKEEIRHSPSTFYNEIKLFFSITTDDNVGLRTKLNETQ